MYKPSLLLAIATLFIFAGTAKDKKVLRDVQLFEQAALLHEVAYQETEFRILKDSSIESKIKLERSKEIRYNILERELDVYEELLDSFPSSPLAFRALNNKAYIEFYLEDFKEAKEDFLKILSSNANDMERGGTGSGIMAEPYANYKNRAAKMMADMMIADTNYKEAIKYLELTKKYKYRHFCGNEYAADAIYMATLYGRCYAGLGSYDSAYHYLLPGIMAGGLADNNDLIQTAISILLKQYSRQQIKNMYETSVAQYSTEETKDHDKNYYITLLHNKIYAPYSIFYQGQELSDQEIKKYFLNAPFYKLLCQQ